MWVPLFFWDTLYSWRFVHTFVFVSNLASPTAEIRANDVVQISSAFYASFKPIVSEFTTVDGWYKDDVKIDFEAEPGLALRATDDGIAFNSARTSDSGFYHFTASNERGTAVSNKIQVVVMGK